MKLSPFGNFAYRVKILGRNQNGDYYYRILNPFTWLTLLSAFVIFFGYCAFTENRIQDVLFETKFKLW